MGKAKVKEVKKKEVKKAKAIKAEKVDKPAKAEKPPKAEKAPKVEKPPKAEKPPKVEKESRAAMLSRAAALKITEEDEQNLKKWQKLQKQYAEEPPLTYNITGFFDIKMPIQHKVHGWGIVLNRRENYIDVLFEHGMKTLIMNVKP